MDVKRWDGRQITESGCYHGVPIELYHSGKLCDGPSISSSGLRKIISDSPAHYWAFSKLNPHRADEPESDALTIGRAVHHVLLGEPNFKEQVIVRPEKAPDGRAWNGNNASCKAWIVEKERAGLSILTAGQIDTIKGMALALAREPLVLAGALNGLVECTFAWKDEETGVCLLARPDNVSVDSADFIDLKTTASVKYEDLVRTIDKFGYHQQAALVAEGYRVITGREITSFSNYFIEKQPPYCSNLRQFDQADLDLGAQMNRAAIRQFVKCWNAKHWPGPGGDQRDAGLIRLSDRARKAMEKKLAIISGEQPNE